MSHSPSPFSLRLLSSVLLVSQAKSIGTLRDATPHAPPAIRRLHTYALSVVAVVAQLPLIVLTVVAVPGSWGGVPLSSSAALATTPSIVLDPPGKFQCIVEAAVF